MGKQENFDFATPTPEHPETHDPNVDLQEMDRAELEKLIPSLEQQILANSSSDPAWTRELQARLAKAIEELEQKN